MLRFFPQRFGFHLFLQEHIFIHLALPLPSIFLKDEANHFWQSLPVTCLIVSSVLTRATLEEQSSILTVIFFVSSVF